MRYGSNIALITAAHGVVVSDEKHVNKCWHGEVQVGCASPVAAIIKDLDPRQFANEIVAHALCRVVGLPIPDAYIVINDGALPEAGKGPVAPKDLCERLDVDGGRLMFASAKCGNSFSTTLNLPQGGGQVPNRIVDLAYSGALAAMRGYLMNWRQLGVAAAFDEWAAVIDRHWGNLLLDENRNIWLIDHTHAFTGADWTLGNLPQVNCGSWLITDAVKGMTVEYCRRLAADGIAVLEDRRARIATAFGQARAEVTALKLIPEGDLDGLEAFLEERHSHFPGFLEQSISASFQGVARG
jgi:hypothetical protein